MNMTSILHLLDSGKNYIFTIYYENKKTVGLTDLPSYFVVRDLAVVAFASEFLIHFYKLLNCFFKSFFLLFFIVNDTN